MKNSKYQGFLALIFYHSIVALCIYLAEGEQVIPSYIFAAVSTSLLTQPFIRYAFYSYWYKIPISQRIVAFLLPGAMAVSSGELVFGIFIFSIASYWFYSFYARQVDKNQAGQPLEAPKE